MNPWNLSARTGIFVGMNDVHTAAQELLDRYGKQAVEIAIERVKTLEGAADWSAHAIALRVLTEVERLANKPAA